MKFCFFVCYVDALFTCSRSVYGSDDTSLGVCLRECAAFCGIKLEVHTARVIQLGIVQAMLLPQFVVPTRPMLNELGTLRCQNSGCSWLSGATNVPCSNFTRASEL